MKKKKDTITLAFLIIATIMWASAAVADIPEGNTIGVVINGALAVIFGAILVRMYTKK